MSLKIRDYPKAAPAGILQLEYHLQASKNAVWYDMSLVDCDASLGPENPRFCPLVKGGVWMYVKPGLGSVAGRIDVGAGARVPRSSPVLSAPTKSKRQCKWCKAGEEQQDSAAAASSSPVLSSPLSKRQCKWCKAGEKQQEQEQQDSEAAAASSSPVLSSPPIKRQCGWCKGGDEQQQEDEQQDSAAAAASSSPILSFIKRQCKWCKAGAGAGEEREQEQEHQDSAEAAASSSSVLSSPPIKRQCKWCKAGAGAGEEQEQEQEQEQQDSAEAAASSSPILSFLKRQCKWCKAGAGEHQQKQEQQGGSEAAACPEAKCSQGKCEGVYGWPGSFRDPTYNCKAGVDIVVEMCTEGPGMKTIGPPEDAETDDDDDGIDRKPRLSPHVTPPTKVQVSPPAFCHVVCWREKVARWVGAGGQGGR
ncbi:hypothetical protein N0V83_000699 [Neocucurbitaria cava]|uniref:Uncharacterized protein n=1 Tax=Neocucurbitaria cava TaxID=798079 RepID=A0A9W8YHS7_9PLEO|nr:hypothetical protein N0V83_000699 [Neocucurbitaria cava]